MPEPLTPMKWLFTYRLQAIYYSMGHLEQMYLKISNHYYKRVVVIKSLAQSRV